MVSRTAPLASASWLALLAAMACGGADSSAPPPDPAPVSPSAEGGARSDAEGPALGTDGGGLDGGGAVDDGVLTILTANLHCLITEGTAHGTNAARAAAVAALVARERIEVILAQELCEREGGESMSELILAALRRAAPGEWALRSAKVHLAWAGTPDEAQQLMGVFSRVPVGAGRPTVHRAQGSLRRVTLGARVSPKAMPPLDLYDVHFDHQDGDVRTQQARELAVRAVLDTAGPTASEGAEVAALIAGDFNARPGESAYAAAASAGFVDVAGGAATKRIDHAMLHRAAPWEAVEHAVVLQGDDAVSDHPLVLVRLRPKSAVRAPVTVVSAPDRGTLLSLRGDRAPLTWVSGWPLLEGARPGSLLFATTELTGRTEGKLLAGDAIYQAGDNVAVDGAREVTIDPTFP